MSKQIIIANWKINLEPSEEASLAKDLLKKLEKIKPRKSADLETVICPSFLGLSAVAEILKGKNKVLSFGAQDCFWEDKGNFTGGISSLTLKQMGCEYVILGHSERRENLKETGEMINKKIKAVLRNNLIPIICLGETKEERDKGLKEYVVLEQVSQTLRGINFKAENKIIIAYEPVWINNNAKPVEPREAEYFAKIIQQRLIDLFPLPFVHGNIRIIYGGSVNSQTVKSFVSEETISGVLVGSASLKVEEFIKMCENF
jgi:triosephosphate isomerase